MPRACGDAHPCSCALARLEGFFEWLGISGTVPKRDARSDVHQVPPKGVVVARSVGSASPDWVHASELYEEEPEREASSSAAAVVVSRVSPWLGEASRLATEPPVFEGK